MVDILLASFNGAPYISEQLASITAQTYPHWRLVIHDDGSTDGTVQTIRTFFGQAGGCGDETGAENRANRSSGKAEAYANPVRGKGEDHAETFCGGRAVLQVNAHPTGRAAANFMGLLAEASAEYAMFSDQDDVWKPDKIEASLRLMKRMEKKYGKDVPLLVYTDLTVTDEQLTVLAESFFERIRLPHRLRYAQLLVQNNVAGCTILMNRALYTRLRMAYDTDRILMHDHFAVLVARTLGHTACLRTATAAYRQHGDNGIGASDVRSTGYLTKRFTEGGRRFRCMMQAYMRQAGYICELYADEITDGRKRELLLEFSRLEADGKRMRIRFYIQQHVLKYGTLKMVMQLLWG